MKIALIRIAKRNAVNMIKQAFVAVWGTYIISLRSCI